MRWDRLGLVSEEEYSTFKLKYEGLGSDLRPTNQEAAQERSQAVAAARQQQQPQQEGAGAAPTNIVQASTRVQASTTTAPPQETTTTTTTTAAAQQPLEQVPQVETVLEEEDTPVEDTIAQAAVENANARTVDPDVLEEEDDRFDVATDFELYNEDDIAEYDGDRHAREWTS